MADPKGSGAEAQEGETITAERKVISFFVPGIPRPHQHRQTKMGVMYLAPKAKEWQKSVRWAAVASCGPSWKVYVGPVGLHLGFYFPLAKSNKTDHPGDPHLQDPDATNLLKCAEDGLKRTIFIDDCMVSELVVNKYWCTSGCEGMEVKVYLG